jgi:hypothetical protein
MDKRSLKTGLIFVALTAVFFLFFYERPKPSADMRFMGKWTEATGEPGNYVQIGQTWKPSHLPGVQLGEGWVIFHKQLGEEDRKVSWGFGHYDPLELNVIVPGKCNFAYIRLLDDDHMLVRFTSSLATPAADDDWFNHAETKLMTRVRQE